ncbi:hypothetical protein SUGI_0016370 [Cryptomeria japonica]|uniref:putative transcription factor bHLH041 n=1 Tax=Cryptomeria japonica TaxID=3369 RepID=UPI002408B205|nr:putative transcription factor bHLH041 [Cryptomeria japonica]GLJ05335.1 hypothetical protein SUGI_0016370 [Cryptomeria japonica]
MDIVLDLDDQSLQLFMRNIVASFGGNYVVVWTLDQTTRELVCRDGWYNKEMEAGSSSMTESVGLRLFNFYRLSRFALGIGVPALALDTQTFIWLKLTEVLNFCCNDEQRNFYIVAGIQTVIFVPCGNGVIELGTTNPVPPNEDFQLQISNALAPLIPLVQPRQTSSSTSSFRSIDSPESSTTTTTTTTTAAAPEQLPVSCFPVESFQAVLPFLQPFVLPYQISTSPSEYMSSLGAPQPRIVPPQLPLLPRQPLSQLANRRGAFGAWRAAGVIPRRTGGGHMRFKRSVELLKHIHAQRMKQFEASATGRPTTPISSSQLHHMISERRRREKLKESFDALRSLLPPGSRKDKASILANTREYLSTLNSRVQELQTANQRLESLSRTNQGTGQSGENAPQTGAFIATAVTVEEEEEQQEEESIQSAEFGLRITVTNPSNTIDVIISVLNTLRQMEIDMISLTSQTEAAPQLTLRLRIRLPQETRGDPARRGEIKDGIQRTLNRRPQN